MRVESLCANPYAPFAFKRYTSFDWKDEWIIFLKLQCEDIMRWEEDRKTRKEPAVRHVICWYDTNILQAIGEATDQTLNVRLRIVCCMVEKIPYLSEELKRIFVECMWDTYYKFLNSYYKDWYFKYINPLPF